MRARLTLTLCSALLVLTGCSGGSPDADGSDTSTPAPDPDRQLVAGSCWTDEQLPQALGDAGFTDWVGTYAGGDAALGEAMQDDAAFSEQVDCAQEHALELYAVVGLPAELDAQVTSYADLLDTSTPLYGQVRDAVNGACLAGSVWGQAQAEAQAPAVQLGPALKPDGDLRLAWDPFPGDLWEAGQRQFVCTMEQRTPGTLAFADLATARTPQPQRVCLNIPVQQVPCGAPHQAEEIGEISLNAPVAAGAIDAQRALQPDGTVALTDAEYAPLDRACATLLGKVSTGRPDVEAQAFAGAADQWPDEAGVYVASCFALKPFDPPPTFRGTVFDR